ncbi:MAG: sporulation protein YqfC [Clostridiales bacterium]|jgi:sporulation protein YqfC|nr:sporulation protein YqfC [Clostridiales bacterium]
MKPSPGNTPEKVRAKLSNIFELPADVVLDLPRFMLVGNSSLLIENHEGILEYSEMLVRVATKEGTVAVTGQELELEEISTDQIMISGRISALKWPE